jgi:predicted transcriptional regulator
MFAIIAPILKNVKKVQKMEGKLFEVIQLMGDFVIRADNMNKRLTWTIRIAILAFAATITICFGILYTSDYEVTSMQQQQISDSGMQQQQK